MLSTMEIELLDLYRAATGNPGVGSPTDAELEGRLDPRDPDLWIGAHRARRELVIRYSWSVPTPEAVSAIAALGPLVDPMAGSGYWPYLLDLAGVDVVAFDRLPPGCDLRELIISGKVDPGENLWHAEQRPWFPIAAGDAPEVAAGHADRTLLLSWPPYNDEVGEATEDAYWRAGGQRLVYIGEPGEGCTGTAMLHARLGWAGDCRVHEYDFDPDEYDCSCDLAAHRRWVLEESISLPQWDGMHDGVFIFTRKEAA